MKKTLEAQALTTKSMQFEEPMNHGGIVIHLDYSEMDLKYTYESDTGLQAITDFVYHVFTEEKKDYHLMKKLQSYMEAYQQLFEKRGYADSVSFTFSEETAGVFHMTPLDDLTKDIFPEMCYFMYHSSIVHPEDMFLTLKWHRHSPSEISLKVMKEVPIPTIEDSILDLTEELEHLLDPETGEFQFTMSLCGKKWMKAMEALFMMAEECRKNPGVYLVSRAHGKNRYYKPFHSFS